ncbi:hypothetical protein FDK15_05715 [Geobacillus thermoleovorans]|nr:hypothetical protein FDK15_05715 [Geobacillus thermoleovorans]
MGKNGVRQRLMSSIFRGFSEHEQVSLTTKHEHNHSWMVMFTEKIHGQWFALHPGMKMTAEGACIFTEKIHGQRFALHPGMKMTNPSTCIFTEKSNGRMERRSRIRTMVSGTIYGREKALKWEIGRAYAVRKAGGNMYLHVRP